MPLRNILDAQLSQDELEFRRVWQETDLVGADMGTAFDYAQEMKRALKNAQRLFPQQVSHDLQ